MGKLSGCASKKIREEKKQKTEVLLKKVKKMTEFFEKIETNESRTREVENLHPVPARPVASVGPNFDAMEVLETRGNDSEVGLVDADGSDQEGDPKTEGGTLEESDCSTWKNLTSQMRDKLSIACSSLAIQYPDCVPFLETKRVNRYLNRSLWFSELPNGDRIKRTWLSYSKKQNSLFCLPCKLYSTASKSSFATVGLKNWRKVQDLVNKHDKSEKHRACMVNWKTYLVTAKKKKSIDICLQKSLDAEIEAWREVIRVIIDVTMFLAVNCLAFRGDDEGSVSDILTSPHSKSRGNFYNLLVLLSKYNPVLKKKLQSVRKFGVSYFSKRIQNEVIEMLGNEVRLKILDEIIAAKYYTIMFDCTPDTSHKEQMTQIIRYVHISGGKVEIKEVFLDFLIVSGKTGHYIASEITKKLEKDGLKIEFCRGQSYDNGSNMAGIYKGVQAEILNLNEYAKFIPCLAHSLNLVGVHAASSCAEAVTLFGIVQKVWCFFAASTGRWEILMEHTKNNSLHATSNTRWSAKAKAVSTLLKNLKEVIDALNFISSGSSTTPETRADVNGLIKSLSSFKFIATLNVWNTILNEINRVNIVLQKKDITLSESVKLLKNLISTMDCLRNLDVMEYINEATQIAARIGVVVKEPFAEKRLKKKRKCPERRLMMSRLLGFKSSRHP